MVCCRTYDAAPARDEFERECERCSCPALLRGFAAKWPALSRWDPSCGGVAHLRAKCGDAEVVAMTSSSTAFYGALRQRQLTATTFGQLLESSSPDATVPPVHVYLAQAPLLVTERAVDVSAPLAPLLDDLPGESALVVRACSDLHM